MWKRLYPMTSAGTDVTQGRFGLSRSGTCFAQGTT